MAASGCLGIVAFLILLYLGLRAWAENQVMNRLLDEQEKKYPRQRADDV